VLADHVGSWDFFQHRAPALRDKGVEVRAALPVSLLRRKLARMDLRNHRKLVVIDGHIAYAGSQNIVNADYGHKDLVWHDVMLRMRGPILMQLQHVFVDDWQFTTRQTLDDDALWPGPQAAGDVAVQTLPSGPTYPTENYQRLIVAAIHAAQHRIMITSPYLVPDDSVINALQIAVLRGVAVDMIVPAHTDHPIVMAAARGYYGELLRAGIRLHLHSDGLLHSKIVTIDDSFALLGSGNFDIRSFYLNFELNILLYGESATAELRFLQRQYMQAGELLTLDQWQQRPAAIRFAHDIARLLSPLL